MYKINQLARLAGITSRTLRYYDQINLLKPNQLSESGYRLYGEKEVNTLQTILFYKELGYELETIKEIVCSSQFDIVASLNSHLDELLIKKDRVDNLISLVLETISTKERNEIMKDDKKFEAFKEKQIQDNDEKYGKELEEKYSEDFTKQVNDNYKKKSKYQFQQQEILNKKLNDKIIEAFNTGDPSSTTAQEMCELHKEWILFYWPSYDKNHHLSLVKMYTEDDRFKEYYDKIIFGSADFMYQAMKLYIEK